MTETGLYERVLAQIERGARRPERAPPRPSAAVVLWRRRAARLEVFWIERSHRLAFMAGFYAFPGGGMTAGDRKVGVRGLPVGVAGASRRAAMPPAVLEGVDELGSILPQGLVACALRELFEETGVLVSPGLMGDEPIRPALLAELDNRRQRLEAKEIDLPAVLAELGLELVASGLVYAGRWLTPPLGPLRFDNRFFLLEWPHQRTLQPAASAAEAASGEWIEPGEALARWRRGTLVTAPPILHILTVMAEEGPVGGLARLREPEEANLGPHRRIEFRPGVLLLPVRTPTLPPASFTNAYVLGTGEAVLVDPGSPAGLESERLRQAVEALPARLGRRVRAIWLTHHHPDHVGGVEVLRNALEVPVCAHRHTAERLREVGIRVDEELVDGQRVVLSGEPPVALRVVHSPGHSRGHLCFFDETFGSLVCGDLVAGFGTIVIDPPEGNMEDYLSSLRRARELEPKTLFPAHGPPVTNAVAKLDDYLRHRLWREQRVFAAWQAGRRQPAEMVAEVYDDVPALARPLAERQIEAHLERLRAVGKVAE